DDRRRLELPRREVHRHRERRLLRVELLEPARFLARGLEHPPPERDDETALLGERDEVERRDHPALGMLPAHERLEARDPLGLEGYERLVVQHELVVLERALQLGPELNLTHDTLVRGRLIHLAPPLALIL